MSVQTLDNQIWRDEKKLIITLLENYPKYEGYMEMRKYELEHPVSAIDDNVGGGKAQFKQDDSVDRMIITTDEDYRLNALMRVHSAIRVCLDDAPEDVQIICQELYFKKYRNRTYHTIPDLCNSGRILTSKSAAYDEFNDFLKDCADSLGLLKI